MVDDDAPEKNLDFDLMSSEARSRSRTFVLMLNARHYCVVCPYCSKFLVIDTKVNLESF